MEPGGSMAHSRRLFNKLYPDMNQPNSSIDTYIFKIHTCHPRVDPPKDLFPVGLPINISKSLLPSSILATLPA